MVFCNKSLCRCFHKLKANTISCRLRENMDNNVLYFTYTIFILKICLSGVIKTLYVENSNKRWNYCKRDFEALYPDNHQTYFLASHFNLQTLCVTREVILEF